MTATEMIALLAVISTNAAGVINAWIQRSGAIESARINAEAQLLKAGSSSTPASVANVQPTPLINWTKNPRLSASRYRFSTSDIADTPSFVFGLIVACWVLYRELTLTEPLTRTSVLIIAICVGSITASIAFRLGLVLTLRHARVTQSMAALDRQIVESLQTNSTIHSQIVAALEILSRHQTNARTQNDHAIAETAHP